jgi:ABC-2 type transport system permease protein
MSTVLSIAREEWRLWLRSKIALLALITVSLIIAVTSVLTASRIVAEQEARHHQQEQSEEAFLTQPDRHPHRMVHYGHYVFRAPPPLAIIDPGVDAVTGQSIFLEGHRQNTAMFADARASANIGSLQGLTPAFVYQILVPLLLIALGHGLFVREREAKTLAPLLAGGVSGNTLYTGKCLALAALSGALLLPLVILAGVTLAQGETLIMSAGVTLGYSAYLLIWCALITLVSALSRSRGIALGLLVFIWLIWALIVPRIAVATASAAVPAPGKLETDFRMNADLRELGDGHNAADPAFAQLRANLLAQYNVETVEELPINFRGAVAQSSERELTSVMNEYAEERMSVETAQSAHVNCYGWLSPMLAVSSASRFLAGTDLTTHHRFLREAEAVRFDFVQGLNDAHINKLSYTDDMNRNQDAAATKRARISADNWAVLNEFEFTPSAPQVRAASATGPLVMLIVWLAGLLCAGYLVTARLKP